MTEWLVIATTFDGEAKTLARCQSEEAAGDFPVVLADWKSVQIVEIGDREPRKLRRHSRRKELAYAQLEAIALANAPCPSDGTGYLTWHIRKVLVQEGFIKIEVYPRHKRVITLLKGPHAGKHTRLPPGDNPGVPYRVIQAAV